MTKRFNLIPALAILLFVLITVNLNAQSRVINVVQGIGTLNEAVDSDTTSSGERIDPENTVYVLERDGYYLTNGTISNSGWPLTIKAADGEGNRPIIMPAVIEGGESTYPFRPRGDFYISGLYVTNQDQDGALLSRPIRASSDSIRLVVDDCQIDYAGQAAFRIDNEWNKIYITNSVISNMGRMSSPANGRGIDDRGNDIDTLVFENNTFYNLTMTVLRDGGGIINYANVNQNTIVNVGQFGIHFGEAIETHFTNNLIINPGLLGATSDETRSSVIVEAIGEDLVNQGVQQVVEIDYNNFYIAPELLTALPDTINAVPVFDSTTTALMEANSTGANNIEEAISFTAGPNTPTDVIASWYNNGIDLENKTDMDDGDGGPRAGQGVPTQMPFDFSYSTSSAAYSAGSEGQPVGDLNWFPGITAVDDLELIPVKYELSDNYPNPFNPSTNIQYSIPESKLVSLVVYNLLGQKVVTLVNTKLSAGNYNAVWNGKNDFGSKVSSGIYIYQLTAGDFVASKRMILMK